MIADESAFVPQGRLKRLIHGIHASLRDVGHGRSAPSDESLGYFRLALRNGTITNPTATQPDLCINPRPC